MDKGYSPMDYRYFTRHITEKNRNFHLKLLDGAKSGYKKSDGKNFKFKKGSFGETLRNDGFKMIIKKIFLIR